MPRTFCLLLAVVATACGGAAGQTDTCNDDFRRLTDDFVALQAECKEAGERVLRQLGTEQMAAILDELGLAHSKFQSNGFVVEVRGVKHVLINHGRNLQFWVGFTAQPQQAVINEWNKRRRFSRAYLDEDGNAVLESDLDIEGGITAGAVREFIKTFLVSVENYAGFVGRTLPPPPEPT